MTARLAATRAQLAAATRRVPETPRADRVRAASAPHDGDVAAGVRSLERGLALLHAMNVDPRASVAALARTVGVPRSTVYRLLATLEKLGYVAHIGGALGYRLQPRVRALSDGYRDDAWLEAAWTELASVGDALHWPLSLFVFEAGTMVIRQTTHGRSTMSIDDGMSGRRMAMTETAAGRAYLAFCPPAERAWLLDQPAIGGAVAAPVDREILDRRLAQSVVDGFGTRVGGVMPKTSSISVPVVVAGAVVCCVSVVWIGSALPIERATHDLAPALKSLAARIAALVERERAAPLPRLVP